MTPASAQADYLSKKAAQLCPRHHQREDGGVRERDGREGPRTPEMNQAGRDKSLWIGPP